ncbi:MAG: SpoIIE family protein phosphatase [Candidatus Poribacteria bacterium]|nr:SpoIIE family protein phosphatase [Candidatus Poribacteria bacterium]
MLSEQQKLTFLQKTDLFTHVPTQALMQISKITQEQDYPAGHILFREGDEGDSLYLIVAGEVGILKEDTLVITLAQTGACIGEMALIEESEPRSATIKITQDTTMLRISRDDFYHAMSQDFLIARGMFRVLNAKIRADLSERFNVIRQEVARQESMRMAAEVQQSLLPSEEINHPQLVTAGYCQPADSVGGDYYDYLQLSADRFAIFLGDVMGHGYHSAMLTAMTKSGLHTQIQFDSSIPAVINAINRVAEHHIQSWIYLTCCYVIIDLANQKLEFANAGHPSMLLYRAATQEIIELESQFMPLGLLPTEENTTFYGEEVAWYPGDALVLYSDGITEAGNLAEELYGDDRLREIVLASAHLSPPEIKQAILADLEVYRQGSPMGDDVTLVVAKWL